MDTNIQGHTGAAKSPLQAPQWLYDLIMRGIEPDLMSDQIPQLEVRYREESVEGRRKRMDRYEHAFAQFDEALENFSAMLYLSMEEAKAHAQEQIDVQEQVEREAAMKDIEASLDSSSSS